MTCQIPRRLPMTSPLKTRPLGEAEVALQTSRAKLASRSVAVVGAGGLVLQQPPRPNHRN
eukprot:15460095-Alexandrium_andersonii.AAC.1